MKYLGQPQSGSQANTTASHNRAGQYLRNRRTPVSPTRTPKQGLARARFGTASAAWQSLTAALQSAWTSFAMSYPVVDSLGQSIVLTGQQYFIGIQSALMHCGQPMNTAVPTNTAIPAVVNPTLYADTDGTIIVSVDSLTVGDFNTVGCSPMLSNGVNFNKQFSLFAVLQEPTPVADISAVYASQYGAPVAGKKIFFNTKEVNSSGMTGSDTIKQTNVQAPASFASGSIVSSVAGQIVLSGAGLTATMAYLFPVTSGAPSYAFASQTLTAGGCTVDGAVSGQQYYVRVTDGVSWSQATAVVTCA